MSAARDLQDLLDQVSETRGWRVANTRDCVRIYPSDPQLPPIFLHTASSAYDRQLMDLRTRLRRANFPFKNGNSLPPSTVPKDPAMPISPAPATVAIAEKTTIQKARDCITRIMDDLSTLDSLLAGIDAEGQEWQKAKAALATMLGR